MSSPTHTAPGVTHTEAPEASASPLTLALVLMVAHGSLARTGERVFIKEGETVVVGRHDPARATLLAHFAPHRPGMPMPPPSPAGGLPCPSVSHEQLRVTATKDGLWVKVLSTRPTLLNDAPFTEGLVRGDDVITLVGEAVLLCIWTPMELPMPPEGWPMQPFGKPDLYGIRGESAAAWNLRRTIAFAAKMNHDVVVGGESGTGKTAVCRAIHQCSARKNGPIVKRSAKQFTETLAESQLFGTASGFVGAGKQSFPGLFPEAAGGTIVLDQIGLAPHWLQEMLLSTLDDGVYTMVGAAHPSQVDVRIIGSTNAEPKSVFLHDFDARLAMRVMVPPMRERRDDIGLALRDFLEEADATITDDPPSKRRISPTFVAYLVRHALPTNARQIRNMMLAALAANTPGQVKLPKSIVDELPSSKERVSVTPTSPSPASAPPVSKPRESRAEGSSRGGRPPEEPVRGEAQALEALEKTGWDVSAAAVLLGISRSQMLTLMKKLGLKRPGK